MAGGHVHRAFGLRWRSDIALDGFASDPDPAGAVDVAVRLVDRLPQRVATGQINRGTLHLDGIRFTRERAMIFDMIDGNRIDCLPLAGWSGRMPVAFHATVAALTLAWRGAVPLHASAVAVDGRGIVLCGASGAGKSTLTASMLASGAQFVGDDLTAIWPDPADAPPSIAQGRPAIRLHPETAGWIDALDRAPDAADGRGKWRVVPSQRVEADRVPLSAVVMVGGGGSGELARHMFRPRWMAALPGHDSRLSSIARLADRVPVLSIPAASISGRSDFESLGRTTLDKVIAALG